MSKTSKIAISNRPNALVPQLDGQLVFNRFNVTPVGADMPEDITEVELEALVNLYQKVDASIQWVVGDLAHRLKAFKGDGVYEMLAEKFRKSPNTIREWAHVCGAVDLSIRIDKPLTFKHHQVVAALTPQDQKMWLTFALQHKLGVERLRTMIRDQAAADQMITSPAPAILKRFERDYQIYRKGLVTMEKEDRNKLREMLLDLISRIDLMERH